MDEHHDRAVTLFGPPDSPARPRESLRSGAGGPARGARSAVDILRLLELLLIRHALPLRVEVATGPADPELSDLGHAQARHLAEYLEGERVNRLITSPLRRAVQTAQPVSERLGLDTEVHEVCQ